MPSVTRPRKTARPRREATEAGVFDAVEELLAGGARFTELGVGQIADAAGIGRSTFYVHFTDKTDLLVRLARARTADLFGAGDRWLETGGYDALEAAIAEVCRQRRAHAGVIDALTEVAAYDPVVGEFWHQQVDGFARRLAARLPGDDPEQVATFLTWGVERTLEQQTRTASPDTDERQVRAIARSIWAVVDGG